MVGILTADNGALSPAVESESAVSSLDSFMPHQPPEREAAMKKSFTERVAEVAAIPEQLTQVSEDVTKILVTVSLLALLALLVASAALVVASNAH